MMYIFRVIYAEFIKQIKNKYHSGLIIFSMLLWPILKMYVTYFVYKPFEGVKLNDQNISLISEENMLAFLLYGYLALMFYNSFIKSAWIFSRERIMGTIESIYLTPASREAVLFGNALSSMIENVWLYTIFSLVLAKFFSNSNQENLIIVLVSILTLLIPALVWGMFLNSIFIFSRDIGVMLSFLDDPMEIFSGVKIPFLSLPAWARTIGSLFPLTWSLMIIRKVFIDGASLKELKLEILVTLIISIVILICTFFLIKKGEEYSKKNGNLVKF